MDLTHIGCGREGWGRRLCCCADNGLIFQSRRFRAVCGLYRLPQEFCTPYTPEQNGMIEWFFQRLKEECVWRHRFPPFSGAERAVHEWIRWYKQGRPRQSLAYLSPSRYGAQQLQHVA